MLPSQRIAEIKKALDEATPAGKNPDNTVPAIVQYLDEETQHYGDTHDIYYRGGVVASE